jgi:hypothetical protein
VPGSLTQRCLHFESALRGRNQSLRWYRSSRRYQRRVAASTRKTNSWSTSRTCIWLCLFCWWGGARSPVRIVCKGSSVGCAVWRLGGPRSFPVDRELPVPASSTREAVNYACSPRPDHSDLTPENTGRGSGAGRLVLRLRQHRQGALCRETCPRDMSSHSERTMPFRQPSRIELISD